MKHCLIARSDVKLALGASVHDPNESTDEMHILNPMA